jgi:DNA polymerase family A
MSSASGGLPRKFDCFREIWHVDFEFRQDANHNPVPVAMFAKEHRTGAEISMRRAELLASTRAPFDTGPDVLMTAYAAVAELGCFHQLSWPSPRHVLCTYFETSAAINGLEIDGLEMKRPKLIEVCDLFGIPHTDAARKARMIDLVLSKTEYTEEEWREIEHCNRDDVLEEMAVLEALAPTIDLAPALFRGRYAAPVADMEANGLPVDVDCLRELETNWPALRMFYIRRDDALGLYDENGTFKEDRLEAVAKARGWNLPRTATGKIEVKSRSLGKYARHYPELRAVQRLRDQIAELRLGRFLNTIGADGRSRCPIMPLWTRSGRNQPQGRDKVFLLSLPSWLHGVIKPPEGWGIAGLDWVAQEPGIGAGLSGDRAMVEDYRSGDMHLGFLIRAGLAPLWASKDSHREQRDAIKPVSLGVFYGMTKYGIAAVTGKSLMWAADRLARHQASYPVNTQWRQDVVTQTIFDERIVSPLGWPMAVHANTKRRTLMNYMAQAGGADMMRLAAIAAYEAGIHICAPVHDAFWIAAPLPELDDAIATMKQSMERAGREIAGIPIPVEVAAVVRWPQCLGDVRKPDAKGQAMWNEIKNLLHSGALRQPQEMSHAQAS